MSHVKVLDCTLRDGGYIVNMDFGERTIKGIIGKLCEANIDIIECGFLKDIDYRPGITTYNKIEEINMYLPEKKLKTSFVVMVDYGRYSIEKLTRYNGEGVDAIRDCFFKKDRFKALGLAEEIINKGYKVYIQPVDILGYSDAELLELIEKVNEIKPYAFSIVDTFGSMYIEDLIRIYYLINNNLEENIKLGFHSHNNLQLSVALSQKFSEISFGEREVIIDSTVCGMGRGAGNTPTELIVSYLNKKYDHNYNINALLDLVDVHMDKFLKKYTWGYNIPYFVAGIHGSHVHNVEYLMDKHNINTKDLRIIIDSLNPNLRKRYDYDELELLYQKYFTNEFNDEKVTEDLKEIFKSKSVFLLAPGKSIDSFTSEIIKKVQNESPIVISINHLTNLIPIDFVFYNNKKRMDFGKQIDSDLFYTTTKIITSNLQVIDNLKSYIVDYNSLIKREWRYYDNSIVMLLRLLSKLDVKDITIAGFDGFNSNDNYSYYNEELESRYSSGNFEQINNEINEMLIDFNKNLNKEILINFLTPSIFQDIFKTISQD